MALKSRAERMREEFKAGARIKDIAAKYGVPYGTASMACHYVKAEDTPVLPPMDLCISVGCPACNPGRYEGRNELEVYERLGSNTCGYEAAMDKAWPMAER